MHRFLPPLDRDHVPVWRTWVRARRATVRLLPWLVVGAYWLTLATLAGEIKADHVVFGLTVLLLTHTGPMGARALRFILPFLLTGVVHDSQRYWGPSVRGIPHVAEPYLLERALFGISTPEGVMTPNEWLGHHLHPVLDLVAGVTYLGFVGSFMVAAAYLIWRVDRDARKSWDADRKTAVVRSLTWSFLLVNLLGYITWFVYPAAPPWYVELHGLEATIANLPANPARTARFDALLGTTVFAEMYAYEANAFGAIPSLHVAYPALLVTFAVRFGMLRVLSVVLLLLMSFAAVYLNHHYLIDVLLGIAYGVVVAFLTMAIAERIQRT